MEEATIMATIKDRLQAVEQQLGLEDEDASKWETLGADGHMSLRRRDAPPPKPLTKRQQRERVRHEANRDLYRRAAKRLSELNVYALAGEPEKDEHGRWDCPVCGRTYKYMTYHLQSESYPHSCSLKFVDQLEAAGIIGPGLDDEWRRTNFPPFSLLREGA